MALGRLQHFELRKHVLPADEKKRNQRAALSFGVGSRVSVLSVHVRREMRRGGAGYTMATALFRSMDAGGTVTLCNAACVVGEARAFWQGVGLTLPAPTAPEPPRGSSGRAMPSAAVAQIMGGTIPELHAWCCSRCCSPKKSAARAELCLECGSRREDYTRVLV